MNATSQHSPHSTSMLTLLDLPEGQVWHIRELENLAILWMLRHSNELRRTWRCPLEW